MAQASIPQQVSIPQSEETFGDCSTLIIDGALTGDTARVTACRLAALEMGAGSARADPARPSQVASLFALVIVQGWKVG
jgi:hypothetical protein